MWFESEGQKVQYDLFARFHLGVKDKFLLWNMIRLKLLRNHGVSLPYPKRIFNLCLTESFSRLMDVRYISFTLCQLKSKHHLIISRYECSTWGNLQWALSSHLKFAQFLIIILLFRGVLLLLLFLSSTRVSLIFLNEVYNYSEPISWGYNESCIIAFKTVWIRRDFWALLLSTSRSTFKRLKV